MTETASVPQHGTIISVPLNRLKPSPRNARRMPHTAEAIEALAASIAVKGLLQAPVVEPEIDREGHPTGIFFVTIGEGRRRAQLLRAKRKEIRKNEPVRCVVDVANDPHEISLDENVTRSAMHPADQFEAFQQLASERGWGAEEIAARFGVAANVVRQRLRLASVSPALMDLYRDGRMSLEQLMAFTITDDHARQEAVWEGLSPYDREPYAIRRHLTRDRVSGRDRRAVFVGPEAYEAAGGMIERDLFSPDCGGYYADPPLLERLAVEKLDALCTEVAADGWTWTKASLDYPSGHGMRRVYPLARDWTEEEVERRTTLLTELEQLEQEEPGDDERAEAIELRCQELATELRAQDGERYAYRAEDRARAGAFVFLGQDGAARVEVGFIRPEDEEQISETCEETERAEEPASPSPEVKAASPLSDRLVSELTAHRTAALRDRLSQEPEIALTALVHAAVLRTFDIGYREGSCLDVRFSGVALSSHAPGIEITPAGEADGARHASWAERLSDDHIWETIAALPQPEQLQLLAHCVSRTVNALQMTDRGWFGNTPADQLARALSLDMSAYWTPTAENYFRRVNKARIAEAVAEAVSTEAAERLQKAKKEAMAEAAEELVRGTKWLPLPLRTVELERA